jgi:hypothetical protein
LQGELPQEKRKVEEAADVDIPANSINFSGSIIGAEDDCGKRGRAAAR